MSGLIQFFQPFRTSSDKTSRHEATHAAVSAYNQSLGSSATNVDAVITELEETKTFAEWKKTYKEIFVHYITPRMFREEDAESFKTEHDFYWAARFGFIPADIAEVQLSQKEEVGGDINKCHNDRRHYDSSDDELDMLQTQDGLIHEESAPIPSPVVDSAKRIRKTRIIPGIHDTTHKVTSISEMDLMASNLSVPLNSVRLLWKKRKSKGQIPHKVSSDDAIPFPETWMLQGPLHQNYKRVVSMEIMEIDVSPSGSSRREISNVAKAAFGAKTKRVRVFFYNHYADAMMKLIEKAEKATRCGTLKSKETVRDKLMISLRKIPAWCILPVHRHAHGTDAHEKLLERDYGRLASYCICIGGESNINVDTSQSQDSQQDVTKLRFDSEDLEVGVLIIGGGKTVGEVNEYVVNQMHVDELELGVRSDMTHMEEGEMVKLYTDMKALERASSPPNNAVQPPSPERLFATADAGKKRKAQHDNHTYMPLSEVHNFHLRNARKQRKQREICLYAAVFNFGPPRRAKRNWMMSIALIDDSLPLPTENQHDDGQHSISQMKLVIFADNVGDFPQIECAGDILRGHRVLVDEYNGEVSLTAFPWSKIAVCRPTSNAIELYENYCEDNTPTYPTESIDDWFHKKKFASSLNFTRVNELWRFCRMRMSSCPNVDSRYKVTNANIEKSISNQEQSGDRENILGGDLTAAICSIIPYPEDKQTLTSPKGLLRVWDGTGVPRSDTLPENYPGNPDWASREEPSEDVVVSISNIVKHMKVGCGEFKITNQDKNEILDLDCPKCLCGKVVNLVIWEAAHWDLVNRQGTSNQFEVGKFIRVRNAIAKTEGMVSSLQVKANSLVTLIPDSSYEVKSLIISHHQRVQQNQPFNIRSACLPLILSETIRGPPNAGITLDTISAVGGAQTLIDCLMAPSPQSFKVRFRIMDMKPQLKGKSLREVCISNKKFAKFQFVICISDPYLDLAVIVPNAVAEKMFGMSARQVKKEIDDGSISSHQKSACNWMKSLAKQQIVEGTIRSILMGDDTKYFVLSDMPVFIHNEKSS